MARGAAAKVEDDGSSGQGEAKANKRRCVQSACVPCRKRKSKCDGGVPCATCTVVYKTDCHYDGANDSRRGKTTAVKREHASGAESNEGAEFLINSIRTLPEADVAELIQHIRRDPHLDVGSLAETWRKTVTLPFNTASNPHSLEGDLALLLGKPSITQTGDSRHFGHTSGLGLVPEDENYTASGIRRPLGVHKKGTWTTVTQDMQFVERLLNLYFQWSHPFYVIFSRECFYMDFNSGRQKYCSPLLVNAILAYACHFTDEPAGRTDPDNFRTAGDHFFAEARRLLYEDETPRLTTTQALCVMAMREPSAGRDSSGFMYIGRCMRMAVEMGMHLNTTSSPTFKLTPSEIEVRKVTFWGVFTVDTVWSLCIGRISQLPRAAITLDKPILEEATLDSYGAYQLAPGPATSRMFLQEFSSLSELINDNNFMYFAPKERFTSRRLLHMFNKYQDWYKKLPLPLRLPEDPKMRPLSHIVVLHMFYYTCIVHLFRPMLKVELLHSDISPRQVCIEAANKVADLLRIYRQHYDMRACQLVVTHILLSTSVVHLLYSQDSNKTSADNLVESLQALEDLSICHYFGARSYKIVYNLAKTWNLPWPEALKLSKLVPKDDVSLQDSPQAELFSHPQSDPTIQQVADSGYNTEPPPALQNRRESLSMFAADTRNEPLSSNQSSDHMSNQQHSAPSGTLPFATNTSASVSTPATTENAETLFWTPMPGVGVPVLHRNFQVSPMDLNNLLGNADEWDRFGRDGFKMSDTWAHEQMAYHNHGSTNAHGNEAGSDYAAQGQEQGHEMGSNGPSYEWWGVNGESGTGVG